MIDRRSCIIKSSHYLFVFLFSTLSLYIRYWNVPRWLSSILAHRFIRKIEKSLILRHTQGLYNIGKISFCSKSLQITTLYTSIEIQKEEEYTQDYRNLIIPPLSSLFLATPSEGAGYGFLFRISWKYIVSPPTIT